MGEKIRPAMAMAIAPGRVILRELDARGWTQHDLAEIIGRPEQVISEIVRAKKQIVPETARQLASAFGTSTEFWLNLEMHYQINKLSNDNHQQEIERRSKMYTLAPIQEMTRRGWIQKKKSIAEQELEYCTFFNLPSIDQFPHQRPGSQGSDAFKPENRAVFAWMQRAEQLVSEQVVSAFDIEALSPMVERLMNLTEKEDDVARVPYLLFNYGIHFIYIPHMPKTYLDGAMFWINDHPVVALSLRKDRIDAFWFTLLHELAHIYFCHSQIHFDNLFDLDEQNFDQQDSEANRQASTWLFPEDAINRFIKENNKRYSRSIIENFAAEFHRHPGILVGQLIQRKALKTSVLRENLVKVGCYLEGWQDVSFFS